MEHSFAHNHKPKEVRSLELPCINAHVQFIRLIDQTPFDGCMARWCIGKHSSCCLQGGVVAGVVGSNPAGGVFMDMFTLVLKHLHWCIPVFHRSRADCMERHADCMERHAD